MVRLELTAEEAETLTEILRSYLSDLRMEIARTDDRHFRENLKMRETFIKDVLGRLSQ